MTYAAPTDPARSRMTSGYGIRPGRSSGRPTFHAGVDFLGRRGDPVYAVADGVVDTIASNESRVRATSGYGNAVSLHHPAEGIYTLYAHLDEVLVTPGQHVPAGKLIGRVGNTTNGKFPGMGTHLHFEVRNPRPDGGSPFPGPYRRYNLDPEPWLEAHGISFDARGRYVAVRRGLGELVPHQHAGALGLDHTDLDMDYEGLPDEPVRDPWTFDPPKSWAIIATAGALGVAVLASATVILRARR